MSNRLWGTGTIRKDGYVQVRDIDHPVAMKYGYAFVHRMVLYDKIGPGVHPCFYCAKPVEWFVDLVADHRDTNRQNNAPGNLVPACLPCNNSRPNVEKVGCPRQDLHGPYDKAYANGWRYCSKCKNEKEKRRRRARAKVEV